LSQQSKEGGCQCGAVRFRTTDQPIRAIGCHCGTCKQRTGAGYGVGVYFMDEDVEFLHGELRTFEFHSSETGRWLRNHFCPDWFTIGAHIWTGVARSDMCYADSVELHERAATSE
jgi:hypothetical protein